MAEGGSRGSQPPDERGCDAGVSCCRFEVIAGARLVGRRTRAGTSGLPPVTAPAISGC